MYYIYTVNPDVTIGFAASELKKYLRMMQPRKGGIKIACDPAAKESFRIGLMQDFGLATECADDFLDDEIYIKTDEKGGIIAGSNPRAVLLAVYRYLKKQGCIWLFPGTEGEQIPFVDALKPVDYHHIASYRLRGQCNEGAESQPQMMNAIDYNPKVGLNTFMIEGDVGGYYGSFYSHMFTDYPKEAELSRDTLLKWKRECEGQIELRGMKFHDYGHGWTSIPFGIESTAHLSEEEREEEYKKEVYQKYSSLIYGRRGLFRDGNPYNSNPCLSKPEVRRIMADAVVDYAATQDNVNYVHVWLSDALNSHCECEECRKKIPSDWYVMLMNEIDEKLTARKIENKIAFICYLDTFWAPQTERIKNEDRFAMLFAPIKRSYAQSYNVEADTDSLMPYVNNQLVQPNGMAPSLGYLKKWQEVYHGDCFCYEYYFWRAWTWDLGVMNLARTIHDDMVGLKRHNLQGIVADGSQRAYFPNGFLFYVYGEMQYDCSRDFEELVEEYFSAAYGKDWKLVRDYFEAISAKCDIDYMAGLKGGDTKPTRYYNPDMAAQYEEIPALAEAFLPVIEAHLDTDNRPQFIHWELLKWHVKLIKELAPTIAMKARGEDRPAYERFQKICKEMQFLDFYRHDCYDHYMAMYGYNWMFRIPGETAISYRLGEEKK